MKQYQIGAVAKLTGLTVHNLRVWEKRHNAVQTVRTETGRRMYDSAAVERLKLLKACVDSGFAISTVAPMTDDELRQTLAQCGGIREVEKTVEQCSKVCLVGNEVPPLLEQTVAHYLHGGELSRFVSVEAFAAVASHHYYDSVVLHIPSFSAAQTPELASLFKTVKAGRIVLFYHFARLQDVSYLRSLGVTTVKAPVSRSEMHNLLSNLMAPRQQSARVLLMRQPPSRQFSDRALGNAASLSSSIDCECPHHLAELIKNLVAFEQYSAQCESRDQVAADLHHHIHLRTAEARNMLEDLLQSVLEQEGIDLSRIEA